jgi:multidrug efflux pump subunit AcrA (membrane-fusion protein)
MLQRKRTSMFFILCFVLYMGCGSKTTHEDTSPKSKGIQLSVATVKTTEQTVLHEAVGTVKANTASTIASKLMGTVRSISVKEGDRFKKGDLLMIIDPRQVSAQLRQAQAALDEAEQAKTAALSARDQAESGAQLARVTFERYQPASRNSMR